MNREEILSHVDHTLLKPEATWPQIQQLCDEAIANHTASVCINTCYVKQAVEYMAGRIPVCCVVGFPLGAMDTASKAFEAKTAIANGAAEVDMVINIGRLKNKEYDAVREDIRAVKQAVGDKILKVIIETCLLTEEEKEKMCDIVCEAGADYIKTSTGFSTAGANFHDVELMVKGVRGRCKVKAAGGDVVGIGSIVDRTGGKIDFGVPFKAVISMEVESYEPSECPLCKEGKIPVIKPGSRKIK